MRWAHSSSGMISVSFSLPNWLNRGTAWYAASALSGISLVACFPLLNWNGLVWVACLPLLLALVSETRAAHGFLLGYLAGAIFFAGSCYWFVDVMEGYGGLNSVVAWAILALFVIVFSVFFGAFGLLEAIVARKSVAAALVLSPFLWVGVELARTYLITGFPWNLLGYAVRPTGLEQVASVTAVYGLSFAAAATSALAAWALLGPRRKIATAALALWVVMLAVGNWLLSPPLAGREPNRAVLVQPNIPLNESVVKNWAPWQGSQYFSRLVANSVAAGQKAHENSQAPPLIIWPENPAPFYFNRDPVFREAMEAMARKADAYVITGTVTFAGKGFSRPHNSAIVLAPDGRELLQYDKIHLVPFGEYVPWWVFPGTVGKIIAQVGDFEPGKAVRVAATSKGTIGVFICYEAIFPGLVRKIAAAGAQVLVNISDDAWFGDSAAPFQHLEMARFRAIENRRFLLRATNNGVTAIIDPYGRVQQESPRHEGGILTGNFQYLAGETFYTKHGDVFAWSCAVVAMLLILTAVRGWNLPQGRTGTRITGRRNT
jgi:apolipoprotein N-acyltransferase